MLESRSVEKPAAGVFRRKTLLLDLLAVAVPVVGFAFGINIFANELLLVYMMVYVALAHGINISYGFTGYLPFGYFGFFGAGAYGATLAILDLHVPALIGMLFGGVAGVLFGLLLLPLFRLRGAYFAIATLAAGEAIADIVANPSLQSVTNGPYGENLASVYSSGQIYVAALVFMALALLAVVLVKNSRFGLALRAIKESEYSAAMAGVNVVRMRSLAWVIAAAIAGVGGAIFGWATTVFYPSAVFDSAISVFAIVFALFGGTGSVWGPTLGTVLLYGLYSAVGLSSPQYFQLIYGLAIVVLVLFAPRGLVGFGRAAGRMISLRRAGANG